MIITLPAQTYRDFIETWTDATDRLRCRDTSELLPDGRVRLELVPEALALIEPLMYPDESHADALERLLAIATGRVS